MKRGCPTGRVDLIGQAPFLVRRVTQRWSGLRSERGL
ncbi:hypothetical protein KAI37_00892 [Paenibacillus sp. S25]|nr:hypothetical protein KAI37_00892 [Paenibacillus sp. S25]